MEQDILRRAGSDSPSAWMLYTLRVLEVRPTRASNRHSPATPTPAVSLSDIQYQIILFKSNNLAITPDTHHYPRLQLCWIIGECVIIICMLKKVKIADYEVLNTIGVGTFGRVRLVKHKQTNKFFAAKILKKIEILKSKQIDHVQNESQILSELTHPFIIHLEGFCQDARYLYFIMEFVPGGELLGYLRSVSRLQSSQAALYAAQIVLIFQHLHDKGIIFRDLKPENLLIAEDGYLKLTDFSFAKKVDTRTYTLCGTPEYLAPQILLNQGHGRGVDWWTLGILVYEMNAGIDPFTDEDPMIIYQNILKGKVKFPKDFDKEVKSIIKHLLVADVSKRLGMLKGGADDVKQHRWFASIKWDNLLAKKIPMSYKPPIKAAGDTSNFNSYPESENITQSLKPADDPFTDW